MKPSASNFPKNERLETIERRLRLQNAATQIQILLSQSEIDPEERLSRALRVANGRRQDNSSRS